MSSVQRMRGEETAEERPVRPRPAASPQLDRSRVIPGTIQQYQGLIGNRAVTAMLARERIRPAWKFQIQEQQDKEEYAELIGAAKNTDELDVETLTKLLEFFRRINVSAVVTALEKALQIRTGELTVEKEPEPEKEEDRQLREERLLTEGLESIGAEKSWEELEPKILEWWQKLKANEAKETFESAFLDNRMTARQISLSGRGGRFSAAKPDKQKTPGREIVLSRGIQGIEQRTNPNNFRKTKSGERGKHARGLHDLSASLIDHKKPISGQLKGYEDAVVLFMPMPEENDLRIIAALARLDDRNINALRFFKSQMTRMQAAQSSDMGTTFNDVSEEGGPDKFRYGATGTIIRKKGGLGAPATETELKARKTNALEYKKILQAGITNVNEVVVAYRSHASKVFPLYARWDETNKLFHVLDSNLVPRGVQITDDGHVQLGSPPPEISDNLEEPEETLAGERFLWSCEEYIQQNANDPSALRQLLTLLTFKQRLDLRDAYVSNAYLGEDKTRDDKRKKLVLGLIEEINSEIASGTQGLRGPENLPHVH